MPVPSEILAVPRPKNSVVIVYGKNKNLYAVRARIGCKYVNGRHVPVNGPTIGHIEDGKYISLEELAARSQTYASQSTIDIKDWGSVVLCDRLCSGLLAELQQVYNKTDALKIYCTAILRVCNSGIKDYELKEEYDNSFLSELYPEVSLSKNTISDFWNNLGKTYSRIHQFMENRVAAIEMNHHILIDGTLKSDESKVNSLSDYSRKALKKGTRDISILYAYDLEKGEPICSKCFPGNMLDVTSYGTFIEENHITQGIIVGDKGFPSSAADTIFKSHQGLHYMNPLKRDSKYIATYKLHDYEAQLPEDENITYKKVKVNGKNKWLYAFKDAIQAHKEDYNWLHNTQKKKNYDNDKYVKNIFRFGTILLESDIDLSPSDAYKIYKSRWEIELVMRYYKQTCEFDETRVHDDYSVIGSEFCCFIATVMTYRLLNAFDKADLFKSLTYKKIMKILVRAKKIRLHSGGEWNLVGMTPSQLEVLAKLGLIPMPEPKKKRGRKPKQEV